MQFFFLAGPNRRFQGGSSEFAPRWPRAVRANESRLAFRRGRLSEAPGGNCDIGGGLTSQNDAENAYK
jgi:hypothetical protein